jgi:outer membrane protein assembly factor BamB
MKREKSMKFLTIAVPLCLFFLFINIYPEDWVTAAYVPSRTGRSPEDLGQAGNVIWDRQFQYENIATVVQVVTGAGNVYIGTLGRDGQFGGKVHALNPDDGSDVWTYDQLNGGIHHALTYDDYQGGTVFGATSMGEVFALNAVTGDERWKIELGPPGFVVCPCLADNTLLLGDRSGAFYAFNLDGTEKWSKKVEPRIDQTAAAADGIVYFMDEGMRAHALNISDGSYVNNWPSQPLSAGSARSYWPVIAGDKILFPVAMPHNYNWQEIQGVFGSMSSLISHNQNDPFDETLKCLNRSDGSKAVTTAVTFANGSNAVHAPPVVGPDGEVYVRYRINSQYWGGGHNMYGAFGVLNTNTGEISMLTPSNPSSGNYISTSDETTTFSMGGSVIYIAHMGVLAGLDIGQNAVYHITGARDTWGGYDRTNWSRQEWHGAPKSPASVSNGVLYYTVGARVIAIQ